jgi:outer membrane protein assembly factor BamB
VLAVAAKTNFPINIGSPIDAWPLVWNGYVYFGADNGKFYAVEIATGEIVPGWPYDTGAPIKGGASLQLIFDAGFNIIATNILIGSDSGKLYSFTAAE